MSAAIIAMTPKFVDKIYTEQVKEGIQESYELKPFTIGQEEELDRYADQLKDVTAIFGSWGLFELNAKNLAYFPNLEVIYYGAGTMKSILTPAVWERDIRVTTANQMNAIPVAEFTLSQILYSLKNSWTSHRYYEKHHDFADIHQKTNGAYKEKVGIVSFSQIGRLVCQHLQRFDMEIMVYDPTISQADLINYDAQLASLEDIFAQCQVVSLHAPLLPATEHMVTGQLLASMRDHATFINTSRGKVVDEAALIQVMTDRPDLTAILDVTVEEPLPESSPLYEMQNVVLTPHIAGSLGNELARMGQAMADEAKNYLDQGKLTYEITEESYSTMA